MPKYTDVAKIKKVGTSVKIKSIKKTSKLVL